MRSRRKEEEQEEEEGMSPVGVLGGKLICGVWLWGLCWSRHCGWWGGVVGGRVGVVVGWGDGGDGGDGGFCPVTATLSCDGLGIRIGVMARY